MRKKIESKIKIEIVHDDSATKLVTIREDDPLWAYFTREVKEEPEFEHSQFIRLFIPMHATEEQIDSAVAWLRLKQCNVRIMPRVRVVAPKPTQEERTTQPLRDIAVNHTNDVFKRVYGENSTLNKLFTKALDETLTKAGL